MKTKILLNRFLNNSVALFLSAALLAMALQAGQAAAKRPLTHADYDNWRSIQAESLSQDGRFLAYALVPQDADGEVVVRNLATGVEWRHPRGKRPEPPPPREGEPPAPGPQPRRFGRQAADSQVSFTADSRALVFVIYPNKADSDKARREKKRPDELPKNAMGIMDLSSGSVARVERVKSFQVPDAASGFIAYLLEGKPAERRSDAGQQEAPGAERRRRDRRKEYGSDLVARNLTDNTERVFADVIEYTLTDDAKTLAYAVASKNEETNGVYTLAPGSAENPAALLKGKGKYSKLTWDDKQTQLAFLSDRDDAAAKKPKVRLYHWVRRAAPPTQPAVEIVSESTPHFRPGSVISDRASLDFSSDGARLFFGIAARQPDDEEEEAPAEEQAVADLWHWKDDFIQPMQKVRAERERNRSYRAVFHLKEKKLVQLADERMEEANPTEDGRLALGSDDRAYRIMVGYDATYSDYYMVNTADGARKQLLRKHPFPISLSPAGRFALFYDGKDWNTISLQDGRQVNLTGRLSVSFRREDHDSPSTPPPYGNAGWTNGDGYVLLYDRYDVWQIAPDGGSAKNLTDGVGRHEKIEFRYVKLDPEEKSIDPTKPLLLRSVNEWNKDSGFYRDRINGGLPERLVMAAMNFSTPTKAKRAEVYLLTASTFERFPDLIVTGSDFRELKKVSDANPQKAQLLWGTAELIMYKNLDGVPLSATLMKPENFDPRRKYPLLVYIYEQLSNGLHRFVDPRPSHSINASYYVSNGYIVLMPDIVYTIGHPGQSALKCVLPAIQAVVDQGFVDEKAIGIQGHSWGGYQIAYMITQTTRFKAASAGAPVANMTSAYSGIRWGSGLPRQFQYERTQSRIGASLWEAPMLFLENSPVFRADRVTTPLLMLHNDNDDAVPWYQGIEYYLALRRLGREVYLFNYNGEPHGLRKRANQKDYTMRLQQFFDHHLKGAPKPAWMESGIPYLEREKEKTEGRQQPEMSGKSSN